MKIVSFGDSFVYGSELKNEIHGAWPAIIAKDLDCNYETYSVPGCGNDCIAQQIYNYFSKHSASDTLAVINWTWMSRWDFYITKNSCNFFDINYIKEDMYDSMAGADWPTYEQFVKGNYTVDEKIDRELLKFCRSYIGASVGKWFTLGPTCSTKKLNWMSENAAKNLTKFYSNFTGQSVLWNKFRNLQTILSCQYFLETYNIKNIQTYMDHELFDRSFKELCPEYIMVLQNIVEPKLKLFTKNMNFLEWARHNQYKVTNSPGDHPLEDAHHAAANLWLKEYKIKLYD